MPAIYKHGLQDKWDYTPTGEDATAGDVVLLGTDDDLISVVVSDTEEDELGAVAVSGVYQFVTAVTDFAQGDPAYLAGSGAITDDTSDTYAGRVVRQYSTTRVWVDINRGCAPAGS